MRRHHELPFGAELTGDGVRFRLWAPRAKNVALLLEDAERSPHPHPPPLAGEAVRLKRRNDENPPPQAGEGGSPRKRRAGGGSEAIIPMVAEADGWFSLTTGEAPPGSRYRYRVDGSAYPDPASRHQPDGVHGASEVIDPGAYAWRDASWHGRAWHELAIYELHIGTFSETGNFIGAIAHLDHLAKLGITAIELMPIAEFPGRRNWGYDGAQWFAPSSCYGRPEELKALVEECHARGIAVLLDVVYNHFGPEGNYLHAIAPDFFTERHHTPWGAAINYAGPRRRPVRDFVMHNALYWLEEFHLDGLRFDAVHAIFDDSTPDIVTELAETIRHRITGREVHLILENDRNEARRLARDYTAQWNDDLHHALHVLVTGETRGYYVDYADRPVEHLGRALATGFAYQGEASAHRHGQQRGEPSDQLPARAFVPFLQNHDQIGNTPFGRRIGTAAPEPLVHAAVAIVLLSPQIPLLFMGEEWDTERPFPFFCDFAPPLDEAVREGRRREFAHYPEFADPEAQQSIPDPTAEATFTMARLDWPERERGEHAIWLDRYRRLLTIRRCEIVPRLPGIKAGGTYHVLGSAALHVEWRLGDGSTLLLLANFGGEAVPLAAPVSQDRMIYCSAAPPGDALAPRTAAFYLLAVQ
jgi:malto-oligosyltrehalose trehalohydrolase